MEQIRSEWQQGIPSQPGVYILALEVMEGESKGNKTLMLITVSRDGDELIFKQAEDYYRMIGYSKNRFVGLHDIGRYTAAQFCAVDVPHLESHTECF